MRKTTILSTIKLNAAHVEIFSENNIELLQYNFIKILPLNFKLPSHNASWIFTSKNAVDAVYSSNEKVKCNEMPHYCVGEKTKLALVKNGDSITIDADKNQLVLHVAKGDLVKRKSSWRKPKPRYSKGVLAKYASAVTSASQGAVTDYNLDV